MGRLGSLLYISDIGFGRDSKTFNGDSIVAKTFDKPPRRARIIVDYVAADGKTENITQTRKRKERERKGKDRKKFISNHAYSRKSIPNCRF